MTGRRYARETGQGRSWSISSWILMSCQLHSHFQNFFCISSNHRPTNQGKKLAHSSAHSSVKRRNLVPEDWKCWRSGHWLPRSSYNRNIVTDWILGRLIHCFRNELRFVYVMFSTIFLHCFLFFFLFFFSSLLSWNIIMSWWWAKRTSHDDRQKEKCETESQQPWEIWQKVVLGLLLKEERVAQCLTE